MNNKIIIGIDPGKTGAIAILHDDKLISVEKCPIVGDSKKNDYDHYEMANIIKRIPEPIVYIEKVGAMPKQGVTSMFNFGKGYGMWYGICAALNIPMKLVTPQQWKKVMLKDTDKSKAAAILAAKQIFPLATIKNNHNLAEAILIARYGQMEEK